MKTSIVIAMIVAFLSVSSIPARAETRPGGGDEYHRKIDWWAFPSDHPCIMWGAGIVLAIIVAGAVALAQRGAIEPGNSLWRAATPVTRDLALDFRLRERGRALPADGVVLLRF